MWLESDGVVFICVMWSYQCLSNKYPLNIYVVWFVSYGLVVLCVYSLK